uniref:Membrane protein of ER body-like protein n=1 Tax=Solanum lycopersicum TaxID=4081 RepID=A0A3Q7I2J3_SOLLC
MGSSSHEETRAQRYKLSCSVLHTISQVLVPPKKKKVQIDIMAMEVAPQHNWAEMVEETVEEALIIRGARRSANVDGVVVNEDKVSSGSDGEEASKDKTKNNIYFNEVIDAVDFHVVLNGENHGNGDIICGPPSLGHDESENPKGEIISDVCKPLLYGQNDRENPKGEIVAQATTSSISKGSGNETIIEEQVEEETVELEFFDTTSVDKLKHTHNAYCPKCNSHITKVVLRRVKRERRIIIETHGQKSELLGCLSCFRKKLNPFPIFGNGGGTTSTEPHLPNINEVSTFEHAYWLVLNMSMATSSTCTALLVESDMRQRLIFFLLIFGKSDYFSGGFIPGIMPPKKSPTEIIEDKGDDCRIPILEDPRASPSTVNPSYPRRPVEVKDSRSLEIVKCIVYGGLIEAITSLGIVSSAAASDADTMKIVTIGVANLIGGLFVICQNLVDLKYSVGGGSNYQVDRYGELLGQRKHFLLHATFAILSYFVFGLIPPVIYGFTFRKSDDRDYKLIAVAVASLLCAIILAAAKAYTQAANKFSMVSGVGYAADPVEAISASATGLDCHIVPFLTGCSKGGLLTKFSPKLERILLAGCVATAEQLGPDCSRGFDNLFDDDGVPPFSASVDLKTRLIVKEAQE